MNLSDRNKMMSAQLHKHLDTLIEDAARGGVYGQYAVKFSVKDSVIMDDAEIEVARRERLVRRDGKDN